MLLQDAGRRPQPVLNEGQILPPIVKEDMPCPPERAWDELAAGLTQGERAQSMLEHASLLYATDVENSCARPSTVAHEVHQVVFLQLGAEGRR